MPVTRSASRSSRVQEAAFETVIANNASPTKTRTPRGKVAKSRANVQKGDEERTATNDITPQVTVPPSVISAYSAPSFLPAVLSFSLEEAKQHLINADPRFEDIFAKLKCRPYEDLERVDPFRTLTSSILGQQISWLAARSIIHRFVRLFDPSLPEKPPAHGSLSSENAFFPSAQQVQCVDIATLRTAGLSGRKAEYVLDLASRFADGRLSTEKIFKANDEELAEMLIAVRGIGRWTVDMFAMFSLRRPDILPVGDLGVQRGLLRWILSLHSPSHPISISPKKLPTPQQDEAVADENSQKESESQVDSVGVDAMDVDRSGGVSATNGSGSSQLRATTPDLSSLPPIPQPSTPKTPVRGSKTTGISSKEDAIDGVPEGPPPAFTPSINRTLNKVLPTQYRPPPLPSGLTVQDLKSRLDGKKKIKGALLTPSEMEDLTESWKPYRSLGVYYMWALSEGDKSG